MNGERERQSGGESYDPRLEVAVASFLERHRRGEEPSIEEYAREHPELADSIRRLFRALRILEELPQPAPLTTQPSPGGVPPGVPPAVPERLGEYRILQELVRGGMGVVYAADFLPSGRRSQ